ncbi:HET-domain-containing protein, partial [Bimuria novae-zelandiae CBS 107.79]
HLSGNTASEANFHRIRQWIQKCESGHNRCSNQSNTVLSTRVFDLRESNDSTRLVETRGLSGPYICLSHCWGGGGGGLLLLFFFLFFFFFNNIPWVSLPLLFRDTIEICRTLGVQYIWIDKLCIIQHDKNDWASEGSRMAQIFEGSFLTIGATISKDDKKSLFFNDERNAPSLKSYTGRIEDGTLYTVYSRIPFNYHPSDGTRPKTDHEEYPLMTGAWIYQERLLAPRVLYFGEELSWECREASACECSGVRQGMKYDHSLSLMPDCSTEKCHLQWQRMVEEFTWLQLSYEKDRLPAFSGLAQQYRHRLKSEYLAGIWRENLGADLLWFAYPECGSGAQRYYTKKPRKWRAPSWSWASIEGPILFSKSYHMAKAEAGAESVTCWVDTISAECIPSSLNSMGSVAKGRLVIKG